MARLQFREADRVLFEHLLPPGRTLIGRSDRCDLALPSDSVSRVHCVIERRTEGYWLHDRSRNGTRVNGERVERKVLASLDEIAIGDYTATFTLDGADPDSRAGSHTTTKPSAAATHEDLVDATEDSIAASKAVLRFVSGPLQGKEVPLTRARTSLGGQGANVVLDETLPKNAVRIRVIRSRVLIEPGDAAAFLAGVRVRDLTPAMVGEELRIGDHAAVILVSTEVEQPREEAAFGAMVGKTKEMRRLFGVLARMAAHDAPVLLTGESGTGKELAARGLHDVGPRHEGPFVALNCAGIPETLFEAELFGHEKGAFTGATHRKDGAFHRANHGTLFLDEVGELKLDIQSKLLRALESGEVRRVGGSAPEFPDVRIVAATNQSLSDLVRTGQFRADLFFRLAVLTVRLPALRERKADIALIAQTLLARNHPEATLSEAALRALIDYHWPGNAREMRNVLTRAVVLGGNVVLPEHLSFTPWAFDEEGNSAGAPLRVDRDEQERRQILELLDRHGGNRTRAAQELGVPRSSLLYHLNRLGILKR